MSHLKVEKIEPYSQFSSKESKKISNIKFKGKNAYLNSDTRPQPGGTVQVVHRAVRNATTLGTRGNYDEFFAEVYPMRTKIKTRCDNSAFFVTMWLNGEGSNTHDWQWFPARSFKNVMYTAREGTWTKKMFTHRWTSSPENNDINDFMGHYVNGYTNPNGWEAGYDNYDSTPICTASIFFMDRPQVPAGTDIYYTSVLMSTGDHTWFVNRCQNISVGGNYERGVSGVRIEEIAGNCVMTQEEDGIEEYRFGDSYVTNETSTSGIELDFSDETVYGSGSTLGGTENEENEEGYSSDETENDPGNSGGETDSGGGY